MGYNGDGSRFDYLQEQTMNYRHLASALIAAAFIAGTPLAASAAKPAAPKGPDFTKAAATFKTNCAACHGLGKADGKKMGPNFAEVAAKYGPKDVDKLAKKIRAGGAGSFGQVPMPPMAQISEADAKALAQYALSFKGK